MKRAKFLLRAKYPSECYACDLPILKGDPIRFDRQHNLTHDVCPPLVPLKPTKFIGTTDEEMGF